MFGASVFTPGPNTWATTKRWSTGAEMPYTRSHHRAALLPNGTVMLTGGYFIDAQNTTQPRFGVSKYDPVSGQWLASMNQGRWDHTATLLNDGRVLVTGGQIAANSPTSSAEYYTPYRFD